MSAFVNEFLPISPELVDPSQFCVSVEMSLIGACFLSAPAMEDAAAALSPGHFLRPAHQDIFAAMLKVWKRGAAVDLLTLVEALLASGKLKDCGGEDYLIQMAEATPSAANSRDYCRMVLEHWAKRQYVELGQKARNGADLETLKVEAEAIAKGLAQTVSGSSVRRIGEFGAAVMTPGVPMGYGPTLDRYTTCGGYPRQMTVVRAYHKSGKSSWLIGSAIAAAKMGYRVLYLTFADLSGRDIEGRVMRHETGWSKQPDALFLQEPWNETLETFRKSWRIDVYDPAEMGVSHDIETAAAWLDRQMSREPYDICFWDYAQKLTSRDAKARDELSQAAICAATVQRLARKYDVPMPVGAQVTEGKEGQRDKTKGSRVWEEDAGLVLSIKREQDSAVAEVAVEYNRFGPSGSLAMKWNKERVRFEP